MGSVSFGLKLVWLAFGLAVAGRAWLGCFASVGGRFGSAWVGLGWVGLGRVGVRWVGLCRVGCVFVVFLAWLVCFRLGWAAPGWAGLWWGGLYRIGLEAKKAKREREYNAMRRRLRRRETAAQKAARRARDSYLKRLRRQRARERAFDGFV